jgi:hypothetical protein
MKNSLMYVTILAMLIAPGFLTGCKKDKVDEQADKIKVYDPVARRGGNPNGDFTLNWGNNYNTAYGCYLDIISGRTLNATEAKNNPLRTDLIFLAPNDGQNAYHIVTPNFSKNLLANVFWGSNSTNNPVISWTNVNESEVSPTSLTAAAFEGVRTNGDLRNTLTNAKDWNNYHTSAGGSKLNGQVFSARLNMDNRKLDALIYVVDHIGTSGSNGYLKIKIKVTGLDKNNDDQPDDDAYINR